MEEQKENSGGLKRAFGLKMAIIIVMSSIIGSGVFKNITSMTNYLQSPILVILAWVLAACIILFGVWSIGELGAMFPQAGGPFVWLEKIYGKLISFLYGWSCFTVIQSAALAAVAYVFAGALGFFVDLPHLSTEWESMSFLGIHLFANIGAKVVTCLLIIGLTLVNIRGVKKGGLVSLIFTFSIVLCLSFIFCSAMFSGSGSLQTFEETGINYPNGGFSFFAFISVMVLAMRSAFWSFEGWIALGFIGEELKNPKKTMPRAMTIGILIITLFYVLVNFSYLYVLPVDEIVKGISDPNYIGAVAVIDKIFGETGVYIVSGIILISTFGCTNATTLVSARVYYAMARKGLFFKGVEKIHSTNKTPHNALIYQCIWACVMTLTGSFSILITLVILAAFIFYGLIVFGVVIMRIKRKDLERPYKTPGYPFVPIIFSLFCLVLLGISLYETPIKSLIGLLLVLSGLPFYYYWKNKKPHLDYLEKENKKAEGG